MSEIARKRVSILICTRNRAVDLRATLASIALVHVPADLNVELVIVDNGSEDKTRDVVEEAGRCRMLARWVYVGQRGKCSALNRALNGWSGDIVLQTDDDVRVPANWIEKMCRPIADGHADACAGGFLHPLSHVRDWMRQSNAHGCLTDEFVRSGGGNIMLGLNMAFDKSVLAKIPHFDDELGPGALGFYDDTLFSLQVKEAGFRASFVDVQVEHHFPLDRLSRSALLRRAKAVGRSEAYVEHHWLHAEPRYRLFRIAVLMLVLTVRRLVRRPPPEMSEGLPQWEFDLVRRIASHRQARVEGRRRRNYALRGLCKVPAV